MAILFSQADGSDQHYDTYEEFEQAMILMKRLNGEEVPQDLLDEAKAKNGDKNLEPLQVKIDGNNFESAFREEVREATRELAEALDEVAESRTPVSDEDVLGEDVEILPVGTEVTLLRSSECGDLRVGSEGIVEDIDKDCPLHLTYKVRVGEGVEGFGWVHKDGVEAVEYCPTKFRAGDIVRATEDVVGFGGQYVVCNVGELLEVQIGGTGAMCLVKESWKNAYVSENLANIELVCRKEDRKDIDL